MPKCEYIDEVLLDEYESLESWHTTYGEVLNILRKLHSFLSRSELRPLPKIQLVVDSYDLITYCFPFGELIADIENRLWNEAYRDKLFRLHAARACLFHGLPSKYPVILLPPHQEELLDFIVGIRTRTYITSAKEDLIELIGPEFGPKVQTIIDTARESDFTEMDELAKSPEYKNFLKNLCDGFEDIALLVMGMYENGVEMLNELNEKGSFAEAPAWLSQSDFFTNLDDELEKVLKDYSSTDPRREEFRYWFRLFQKERKALFLPNKSDAKAIQLVLEANRRLRDQNAVFLLVSSVESMEQVIKKAGNRAEFAMPGGEMINLFMPLDTLFYYLQISKDLPSPEAGDFTRDSLMRFYKENLDRINEEINKIKPFSDIQDDASEIFGKCRKHLKEVEQDETSECNYREECPFRNAEFREQVKETIREIESIRQQTEDAKLLRGRQPILEPYFERAEVGTGKTPIEKGILDLLRYLRTGVSWKGLLQDHIHSLDRLFTAETGELVADISPFTEALTDEFMDSFFDFPFRIDFQNSKLKVAAKNLAELACRVDPKPTKDEIQRLTREYRLAAATPDVANEIDLVRALILFAYSKWPMVIDLATRYITDHEDHVSHELGYLRARSFLRWYIYTPSEERDIRHLLNAKADCERGLDRAPKDARYGNVLCIVKRYLYFDERIPEDQRPDIDEVVNCYKGALRNEQVRMEEEGIESTELQFTIINNWAFFLGKLGAKYIPEARKLMSQISIEREHWYAAWLDTDGYLDLVLARNATDPKEQAELARRAVRAFKQAKRAAHSANMRQRIEDNLKEARKLAKVAEKAL